MATGDEGREQQLSLQRREQDVIDRFHVLEREAQTLFAQLATLPAHGSYHWQPFFTQAFASFSLLWKYQRAERTILTRSDAVTRWQIGEIASRIGQLYGHYYTRTGNPTYLKQALSFYQSIHDRGYFASSAADATALLPRSTTTETHEDARILSCLQAEPLKVQTQELDTTRASQQEQDNQRSKRAKVLANPPQSLSESKSKSNDSNRSNSSNTAAKNVSGTVTTKSGTWNAERVLRYYARFAATALLLQGLPSSSSSTGTARHVPLSKTRGPPTSLLGLLEQIRTAAVLACTEAQSLLATWVPEFDAALALATQLQQAGVPCPRVPSQTIVHYQHRSVLREVVIIDAKPDATTFSEMTADMLMLFQSFELVHGTKADDMHPHKSALYLPSSTQVLAFLAVALRELASRSAMALFISAPSSSVSAGIKLTADDEVYDEGVLHPEDFVFLLRAPVLLVIDTPCAHAFQRLETLNQRRSPLFLVLAPSSWPSSWTQDLSCSILTMFLTDPLATCEQISIKVSRSKTEEPRRRREYLELLGSFMRSLRTAQQDAELQFFLQDYFFLRSLAHALLISLVLKDHVTLKVLTPLQTEGLDTRCVLFLQTVLFGSESHRSAAEHEQANPVRDAPACRFKQRILRLGSSRCIDCNRKYLVCAV
eukprot:m.178036 g.178036  ORF g.178036 m.178036 type:complete len:655 (+) comp16583_c0_seq4:52-2016(+)